MVAAQRAVQRGAAPAHVVLVHEVVVDEQVGVEELHTQGRIESGVALSASGFVSEQDQGAAQPLSPAQKIIAQRRGHVAQLHRERCEPLQLLVEKRPQARLRHARVIEDGSRGVQGAGLGLGLRLGNGDQGGGFRASSPPFP